MNEDWARTLTGLRERGEDRADPVRFRWMEAMVRRLPSYEGRAREVIEGKLQAALASQAEALARGGVAVRPSQDATAVPGPLSVLLGEVAAASAAVVGDAKPTGARSGAELKALSHFRGTWTRLSTERRLYQSLAAVPQQAGPLNSQQLMNRALRTMQDASPEYLQHFIAYVDSMLWLEQWAVAQTTPVGDASGSASARAKKVGKGAKRKTR